MECFFLFSIRITGAITCRWKCLFRAGGAFRFFFAPKPFTRKTTLNDANSLREAAMEAAALAVAEETVPLAKRNALPKTNIAPENWWLEDEFPFGKAYFQVLC